MGPAKAKIGSDQHWNLGKMQKFSLQKESRSGSSVKIRPTLVLWKTLFQRELAFLESWGSGVDGSLQGESYRNSCWWSPSETVLMTTFPEGSASLQGLVLCNLGMKCHQSSRVSPQNSLQFSSHWFFAAVAPYFCFSVPKAKF